MQKPNHHLSVMAGEILPAPFSSEWSQTQLEREAGCSPQAVHRSCLYLSGKEAVGVALGGGQGYAEPHVCCGVSAAEQFQHQFWIL